MSYESLAISIELRSGPPGPAGKVVLVNTGSADVRLWNTGNHWGDRVLSFEVLHGGRVWRLVSRPQEYTRNVPSSFVLPAGARHEWPFDLGDGDWEADVPIEQLTIPGAQLVAVYDVPRSPEAESHGVWTGELRSEPMLL